jgi:acetyl-CoA synthetase
MYKMETAADQNNIGYLCSGYQVKRGLGNKTAFRWLSHTLERTDYSFQDLETQSSRAANMLKSLGCQEGDRVFIFMPKLPEQFFTVLGILKIKAIACVLFPNFGPEALIDRMGDAQPVCVFTRKSLLKRIVEVLPQLPSIRQVIVVDIDEDMAPNILSYRKLMGQASDAFTVPPTEKTTPSVLHYTSGSTGKPKGVLHVHGSIATQQQTLVEVLGVTAEDVYWCTADQGWVTGISYGVIGPWSLGVTQVHYGGGFDAQQWVKILQQQEVTVWYSAPTALRMMRQESEELYASTPLPKLRSIFSVGEPLNPEVITWAEKNLRHTIYDTWFQTETGSIMISNRPGLEVKPGSMGKPIQGLEVNIIDDDGTLLPTGQRGNLCLKPGWASMFITYYNHPDVYAGKFRHGHYFTGDTAYRDEDGYLWFTGRSDDVINTAGHLISPFEIESGLLEIPEVLEAGVIGAPDEMLFEKVVAYIALKKDVAWSRELELKIRLHIGNRLSSIAIPQEIRVVDSVPKNKSGKIMRRVLKAWYLGIDAGDTSTMEG